MSALEGVLTPFRFQTLIGTVKRPLFPRREDALEVLFQTLIGTVKRSWWGAWPCWPGSGVSNPHRYGQKGVACPGWARMPLRLFQTLIGTVKRGGTDMRAGIEEALFQTLIGTVKRMRPPVMASMGRTGFKPS